MIFVTDEELLGIRKAVCRMLENEFKGWSKLLGNGWLGFKNWALSTATEAIALGLAERNKYDPQRGGVTTWFYLKARRIAFRDIRCEERQFELWRAIEQQPPTDITAPDPFGQVLLDDDIPEVLAELSQAQVQALALVYYVGYSHQEAASILKRERNAVDALLHRARQKAREIYRRKQQEEKSPRPIAPEQDDSPHDSFRPRSSLSSPDDDVPDGLPVGDLDSSV